jgi:hypothetical protein
MMLVLGDRNGNRNYHHENHRYSQGGFGRVRSVFGMSTKVVRVQTACAFDTIVLA